ncbi:MAG: HAMP domain-containing sensor histidine kinase [Actinomycetia bacterium]|nr:HAMP domain-containing sensor histidine kinase [Actinomycetes bacterium]
MMALLVSAVSFVAVQQIADSRANAQLTELLARVSSTPGPGRQRGLPGQTLGSVVLEVSDGRASARQLTKDGQKVLSDDDLASIVHQAPPPGQRATVRVPGLGRYRFATTQLNDGTRVMVGLPLRELDEQVSTMLKLEAVLAVVVVTAAIALTRLVVVRNLRPLHEVAGVAAEVSQRELDRGEVDLSLRVPERYAGPTSEVGRVGLALNTMLSNVESALAARQLSETKVRQLVADASHELRNPLAAIRGYAELTRRGRDQLPVDTQFAVARIESESERMSRLVEDLLLLARLDNRPDLTWAEVDLRELVLNAAADAQVAGPDHDWEVEVGEDPVLVPGDQFRLHQVVANLLANARTHTPPGTRVVAGLHRDQGFAVVTVTDNGPGIDPELQPKIFERFVRADASRVRKQGQSTGLGLAIVAAVVQAHHGAVSVQSEPGRTVFEVRLRQVGSAAPAPDASPPQAPSSSPLR